MDELNTGDLAQGNRKNTEGRIKLKHHAKCGRFAVYWINFCNVDIYQDFLLNAHVE